METPEEKKAREEREAKEAKKEKEAKNFVTSPTFYAFAILFNLAMLLIFYMDRTSNTELQQADNEIVQMVKADSLNDVAQGTDLIRHEADINQLKENDVYLDDEVTKLKNSNSYQQRRISKLETRVDSLEKAKVPAPPKDVVDNWEEDEEDD
ncbi:MAG: hypothetical protein WCX80_01940 [Patescibacteria group bacterium]